MNDKLIFLDLDGVLNNSAMQISREVWEQVNDIQTHRYDRLSSVNIKSLNDLTDKTGAKIVISSTWRMLYDLDELQDTLYSAGVRGEIIGVTPILGADTIRGNEIYRYIKDNYCWEVEQKLRYVILDDDSDMLYWQRNNFFWCDPFCGLSPNISYKAARFLNGID